MAMSTEKKLGIAVVILLGLGGLLLAQRRAEKREAETYTLQSGKLPKFGVADEQAKAVDQITIQQPTGDAGPGAKVVLKKENNEWKLVEPVKAKANSSNVDSILDNLKSLNLNEVISDSADSYTQYGVDDKGALHAVFNKGTDIVADLYFGHGGSRGQMVRIAGKTGVFGVKGYSSYLYAREAKQWRDMALLKFDDAKVKSVEITNEHGRFEFTKVAENEKSESKDKKDEDKKSSWQGKFRKGTAGGALLPITRFDTSKVDDLVRAYKDLNALDYAKGPVDTGLEKPTATVTFILEDGAHKVVKLGKNADGTNRWVAVDGNDEAFSISSYASDWVTAELDKYQKAEEKKGDKKEANSPAPGGPPPGMAGMGGPPPGH